MNIFNRKKAAEEIVVSSDPATREMVPEPGENGYLRAQGDQAGGDRYMAMAIAIRNRDRIIGALLLTLFVCVFWMGRMGTQSRVEPVYMQVDAFSNVIKVEAAGKSQAVDINKVIYTEVTKFIEQCRSITGDRGLQKTFTAKCYAMVPQTSASKKYLDEMFLMRPTTKIAETRTVEAVVKSQIKKGDSWDLEWEETYRDLQGEKMGSTERWRGVLTMQQSKSDDQAVWAKNPAGIYFPVISWSKRL